MAYRFNCTSCKQFVYLEKKENKNTNYVCGNCNSDNWLTGIWLGFEELDKDGNPLNQSSESDNEYDDENYSYSNSIVISGINIPFWDLVLFLIRLAIASIPAIIVIYFLLLLLTIGLGLFGLGALFAL